MYGGFPKLAVPCWCSNHNDNNILGFMLGSAMLGNYNTGDIGILRAKRLGCAVWFWRVQRFWASGLRPEIPVQQHKHRKVG